MAKTNGAVSVKELNEMTVENVNDKKTLTTEELFKLVNEKFNLVMTKSAMLKLIRLEGYSVSQERCYKAYLQINKIVESKKKTIAEEIAPKGAK